MNNEYIPGVCNIGNKERVLRRNMGIFLALASIIHIVLIFVFDVSTIVKLLLFFPVFSSALSLIQYQMKFCAELGILGKYNFTDKLGQHFSVEQMEFIQKDRVKALKIVLYSFVIGVVVTSVVYILS
jgi:hypothetical protein